MLLKLVLFTVLSTLPAVFGAPIVSAPVEPQCDDQTHFGLQLQNVERVHNTTQFWDPSIVENAYLTYNKDSETDGFELNLNEPWDGNSPRVSTSVDNKFSFGTGTDVDVSGNAKTLRILRYADEGTQMGRRLFHPKSKSHLYRPPICRRCPPSVNRELIPRIDVLGEDLDFFDRLPVDVKMVDQKHISLELYGQVLDFQTGGRWIVCRSYVVPPPIPGSPSMPRRPARFSILWGIINNPDRGLCSYTNVVKVDVKVDG